MKTATDGARCFEKLMLICALVLGLFGCNESSSSNDSESRVRLIMSSYALSVLPVLYAEQRGIFASSGVRVERLPDSTSSMTPIHALLSDQADVVQIGSGSALLAAQTAGQDVVCIAVLSGQTAYQTVLSNKAVEALANKGIHASSPIAERVNALRGLTLATNGPGNSIDQVFRVALREYGVSANDLNIRVIEDPTAMLAALRAQQIDGFTFSPPASQRPVLDESGSVWINFIEGDVPVFKDMPSTLLLTTRRFAKSHPETLTRFVNALKTSFDAINNHPEAVRDVMQTSSYFKEMPSQLYKQSFNITLPIFRGGPEPQASSFNVLRDMYNNDPIVKIKSTAAFTDVFDPSFASQATRD